MTDLPKRSPEELVHDLRLRAGMISGAAWEAPATAAMMREAADCIERLASLDAPAPAVAPREEQP